MVDDLEIRAVTGRVSWVCRPLGVVSSVAGIAGYSVYSFTCRDKAQCNLYHPYIVIFPVSILSLPRPVEFLFMSTKKNLPISKYIIQFVILVNYQSL